jgi:hypothetical protein
LTTHRWTRQRTGRATASWCGSRFTREGSQVQILCRPPRCIAPDAVTGVEEYAAHLVRIHPKILAINYVVLYGRHTDPDLRALYGLGLEAWLGCCRALMQRLADEGKLAEPWTVSTAADMLLALMRDEVVETLAVERAWPAERHTELLATLRRRTFVTESGPGPPRHG